MSSRARLYCWLGGGWLIATDWLDRAREQRRVGRRHEIRQRPIGHRGDARSARRGASAAAAARVASRAQAASAGRPRGRAHRERRVEEDERLRVGPLADELLADDDRLRGGDGDERGSRTRAIDDRYDRAAPGRGSEEAPDRLARRSVAGARRAAQRRRARRARPAASGTTRRGARASVAAALRPRRARGRSRSRCARRGRACPCRAAAGAARARDSASRRRSPDRSRSPAGSTARRA